MPTYIPPPTHITLQPTLPYPLILAPITFPHSLTLHSTLHFPTHSHYTPTHTSPNHSSSLLLHSNLHSPPHTHSHYTPTYTSLTRSLLPLLHHNPHFPYPCALAPITLQPLISRAYRNASVLPCLAAYPDTMTSTLKLKLNRDTIDLLITQPSGPLPIKAIGDR